MIVLFDLICSRSPEVPDHPPPKVPSMWITRASPSAAYFARSAKFFTTIGAMLPPPVTLTAPPVRPERVAQPMGLHWSLLVVPGIPPAAVVPATEIAPPPEVVAPLVPPLAVVPPLVVAPPAAVAPAAGIAPARELVPPLAVAPPAASVPADEFAPGSAVFPPELGTPAMPCAGAPPLPAPLSPLELPH